MLKALVENIFFIGKLFHMNSQNQVLTTARQKSGLIMVAFHNTRIRHVTTPYIHSTEKTFTNFLGDEETGNRVRY